MYLLFDELEALPHAVRSRCSPAIEVPLAIVLHDIGYLVTEDYPIRRGLGIVLNITNLVLRVLRAAVLHIVRRVGKDHADLLALEKFFDDFRIRAVATE